MSFFSGLFGKKADNKTTQGTEVKTDQTTSPDIQTEIENVSGFDALKITLSNSGAIFTRAECQMNLESSLKLEATTKGGILKGFFRSFSTGTFFLNKVFVADGTGSGTATLFSIIPGNILHIKVQPGDMWCIHHGSFLACSENITVETGMSFHQTLTGNGTFYTRVSNKTEFPGNLWLTAYGGILKRDLDNEGSNFRLHGGLFLATKTPVYDKMKISLASSIFSTIAGGQGIMMDFTGYVSQKPVVETHLPNEPEKVGGDGTPVDIDIHESDGLSPGMLYYQTGNIDEFLNFIAGAMESRLPARSSGVSFSLGDAASAVADQAGGARRNRTRRVHAKKPRTYRKYYVKV